MQILSARALRAIPKLKIKNRINDLEYLSAIFLQLKKEGHDSVIYTTLYGEYLLEETRKRLADLGYIIKDAGVSLVSGNQIYEISWSEIDAEQS
jgi:hypothetical protein